MTPPAYFNATPALDLAIPSRRAPSRSTCSPRLAAIRPRWGSRTKIEMQTLYQSVGFRFTDPYPESGTVRTDPRAAVNLVFMQLDL
ncbi:hypothetical protein [Tabrizicola sp.]|uniref:hypothetical protein n=1 Tax=Tabrizicola sp. TaxID=2005166 RepID=UPI0026355371|nr:hypothetical protein [Tabrizicola sp.]MDM7933600.1 hypothetical protein [Tabrizicola sp.]